MKNLIIILVGVFVLSACKKNDDAPTIIGKWYLTRSTYTYPDFGMVKDSVNTNRDNYIQFNADGTGSKNVSLFINDWAGNFRYSLLGNKLNGSIMPGPSILNVTNLTEDELVLHSIVGVSSGILDIHTYYKR